MAWGQVATTAITVVLALLAGVVYNNRRFDDVNGRFDDVHRRIDDLRADMNARFAQVEARIAELRERTCGRSEPSCRRPCGPRLPRVLFGVPVTPSGAAP